MNLPQIEMVSDATLDAALQRAKEAGVTHYYQNHDIVRLFRPCGESWEMGMLYFQPEQEWRRICTWIIWYGDLPEDTEVI